MVTGRTLINALIGAILGVAFSFVPLSTVLGGVAAGFLEGPDTRRGAIVGALAGAITFLPFVGLLLVGLAVLGFGMGLAAVPVEGVVVAAFAIGVVTFALLCYTVGFSLLGGYLGAYLAGEYPEHRRRARDAIGLSSPARAGPTERVDRPASSRPRSGSDSSRGRDREPDRPGARDSSRGRDGERERF